MAIVALLIGSHVRRRRWRIRLVLDGLIIASSLLALSLQTTLGAVLATGGHGLTRALSLAYPSSDIVLGTIALLVCTHSRLERPMMRLIAAAMLALAISDSGYAYVIDRGDYQRWGWLDVGWPAAFLLITVAALSRRHERAAPDEAHIADATPSRPVGQLLPYGPVLALLCVVLVNIVHGDQLQLPARVGATAAALLLLVRQLVMLRENQTLLATVKTSLRRLEHHTTHDTLTGLPNRTNLAARIEAELQAQGRFARFAVLLVNLDRFRMVNESLGHCYGDQLLIQVAETLQAALPPEATLARLTADEFAVLLPGADAPTATRMAERFGRELQNPYLLEGVSFAVEASIGIALAGDHETADRLLQFADSALHAARRARQPFLHYRPVRQTSATRERLGLLADLRRALAREDELTLHYQPKIDVGSGALCGVEALLRWHHPQRGPVPPGEFIEAAEESGIIGPLTLRVLALALDQQQAWLANGQDVPVAVNVSARCLQDPTFPATVQQHLGRRGLMPQSLTLELTERAVMVDTERARSALYRLRRIGVGISIDDFGTGYSSLAYLKNLPVNELKVDRTFITNLGEHTDDAIVRSVIDLGHNLGLSVVAEGIETAEALDKLKHLGCDLAQGYFISRPLPAGEFIAWRQRRDASVPADRPTQTAPPPTVRGA
jgi:diguanylate cyclase (GGDEF)-like protein